MVNMFVLIDDWTCRHDYDVSAAVAAHVNGDGTLDEWSTNTSKPKPKKETHAKPTEANSGSDNSKGGIFSFWFRFLIPM